MDGWMHSVFSGSQYCSVNNLGETRVGWIMGQVVNVNIRATKECCHKIAILKMSDLFTMLCPLMLNILRPLTLFDEYNFILKYNKSKTY